MHSLRLRALALGATAALGLGLTTTATAAPTTAQADTTATAWKPSENSKLNKVATPRLSWFSCYGGARCANAKVPLDYDKPTGTKTNVAVLRLPATGKRIGTLFVNPGGPGGSSTEMAYYADQWLSPEVRAKFDVVGVDPRGVGFSDHVQCLPVEDQDTVFSKVSSAFPVGWTQEQRWIQGMKKISRACSTNALATSMSTAEVARDMEMVRRAIGDGPLSYLGFSYGSHLGTTYANMFPGNFRSIVIDGTLSPTSWSGTAWNQSLPLERRLRSGVGAHKALDKILTECGKAGPDRCYFATGGDPKKKYAAMTASLKKEPAVITDPYTGEEMTLTYADLVGTVLSGLYDPEAPMLVDFMLSDIEWMIGQSQGAAARRAGGHQVDQRTITAIKQADQAPRRAFAYDNSLDAFLSVTCTDSRETTKIADYPAYAKQQETKAPGFGPLWLWGSAGCAGDSFTGQDEDAYVGPYDKVSPKGVLIVGNYWDPATNYDGAVQTRNTLGRSRLISSDSWGHTAYGVSQCVTTRVDRYLVSGASPSSDATCPAESEPFPATEEPVEETVQQLLATKSLPKAARGQGFPAPTVVR
ncbi:alpha/beta hydrolase [Janibacter sp. CX7]|uniref:alpha/beta hydrolase n=1 Tax=Janibacter sp. CX7 TaxID=2963431 RepID=UPI0020CE5512|nr:alpha/beta hydrolase [Janibacter sp. CX7]UTT66352.1 alpha/beta hydrolase [Janibacter sp. CX7]